MAVAPAGNGGAFRVTVKNIAKQEGACRRFAVPFTFLESGLGRVKTAAPSETAPAEMDGNGGVLAGPDILGRGAAVELEGGLP